MYLDYGTQLSPAPILLSIGTLRKPKLIDISELTFDKFDMFEIFLKMTPEKFYTKIEKEAGKDFWDNLTDEQKSEMTMFNIILSNQKVRQTYTEIFNFFFIEPVIFKDEFFLLLNTQVDEENITAEHIRGVIHKNTFQEILELIQQICCIYEKEDSVENIKFKNNLARELYEKMQKAQKKEKEEKKANLDLTIPNIISSVSTKHPSLNYSNIWDITLFQLLDAFGHLQVNTVYEIDSVRVAVWGDEKKTFNAALWYKNQYDRK